MKVEQFLNRNQFHLYDDTKDIFQSYNSQICIIRKDSCEVILGRDWDYSTTTSKHVYAFLDEYSKVRIYGVTNKRKYINDLIKEYEKDKREFVEKHNFIMIYNEEMV